MSVGSYHISRSMANMVSIVALVMGPILLISVQGATSVQVNTTLSLLISSRKNQTGHTMSQASLHNEGTQIPHHWKLKVDHNKVEYAGIQSFHLSATAIAPPPLPSDYQLFPGVGYYKFHTALANDFEDASLKCAQEGGHLAIVNSEAEHQVVQTMFAKHPESQLKTTWAFVGFHDRLKEGEYVTIFGQPLQTTGYTRWSSSGQPDNAGGAENCGSVHRNGGVNDISCAAKLPFFCEYDLTWTDN